MSKFFTFADRFVTCCFFGDDDEAYKITLTVCDDTDRKISECADLFHKADAAKDFDARQKAYKKALIHLIGEDHVNALLSKTDNPDCFAIFEVYQYIINEYRDAKVKKLTASAR